jgi:hypothetical protein
MTKRFRRTTLQWAFQVLRALAVIGLFVFVVNSGMDQVWAALLLFVVTLLLFWWPLGEQKVGKKS